MEKRLKYLFGLFVVGIGLLFNQSFGYDQTIYIDGVTTPVVNGGDSASYLYTFQNYGESSSACGDGFSCSTQTMQNDFGYSLYYNGSVQTNYLYYRCTSGVDCNFSNFGKTYNNSAFGLSLYTGWYAINGNRNFSSNKSSNYGPISVYLGSYSDIGKTFVGVSAIAGSNTYKSPIYGFAKNFLNGLNYTKVSDSDYFRLFFRQNVNLSSPLDGFDPVTLSGSNMTGSYGRQYFYPRGTRTNYGYINDHGQSYNKYKHFGLFGYGYSYTYLLGDSTLSSMSWGDLKFVTVDDSIGDYQQLFGDVSASDFNNLSYRGIMVLRGNSYVSKGNDNGVYLISKNPSNAAQILYEHWSCNTSNLDVIFSGGNSTVGNCIKLDRGYLTYNYGGVTSTYIMPFNSTGSTQKINAVSNQYPFLVDLLGTGSLHGYTKLGNNCIYINSDTHCYGFSSDSGVNIDDSLLGGGGGSSSGFYNGGSANSLYYGCLGPVYNTPDGLPPAYCYNENCELDPDRLKSCYQVIEYIGGDPIQRTYCEINGIDQEISFEQVGSGSCAGSGANGSGGYALVPCEGDDCGLNVLEWLNVGYNEEYFSGFLNKPGRFFKCPFPYQENLVVRPRLMRYLNGFDFALPINCDIAGFYKGKNAFQLPNASHFLDEPLLHYEGENWNILYKFFDILLILGIVFFFSRILKIFKS